MTAENLKNVMEMTFGSGAGCVKWKISDKQFHYDSETKEIFISKVFCDKQAVKRVKKLLVSNNRKFRFKNKYILYVLYTVKLLECVIDNDWLKEIKISENDYNNYKDSLTVDAVNYFYEYTNEFPMFYKSWKEYLNDKN